MVEWSLGPPEFCENCKNNKVLVKINNKWETNCKKCLKYKSLCIKSLELFCL